MVLYRLNLRRLLPSMGSRLQRARDSLNLAFTVRMSKSIAARSGMTQPNQNAPMDCRIGPLALTVHLMRIASPSHHEPRRDHRAALARCVYRKLDSAILVMKSTEDRL
jgi:hypothetical protein